MAKQLPCTADPTHLLNIYSSLHQVHHHLSNFPSTPKLPQPQRQNSLSSATGNEPMQVGDCDDDTDGFGEGNSGPTIDMVEEQMRDCFIKNKRPKRRLSPSAAALAEERRLNGDGFVGSVKGFDPQGSKERAWSLCTSIMGELGGNKATTEELCCILHCDECDESYDSQGHEYISPCSQGMQFKPFELEVNTWNTCAPVDELQAQRFSTPTD